MKDLYIYTWPLVCHHHRQIRVMPYTEYYHNLCYVYVVLRILFSPLQFMLWLKTYSDDIIVNLYLLFRKIKNFLYLWDCNIGPSVLPNCTLIYSNITNSWTKIALWKYMLFSFPFYVHVIYLHNLLKRLMIFSKINNIALLMHEGELKFVYNVCV